MHRVYYPACHIGGLRFSAAAARGRRFCASGSGGIRPSGGSTIIDSKVR